ncbi:MAG: hypothetical protein KA264_03260 [Crocinitomicaceae bacterium]|nr:hypothetical protein [Crocinitomicaceae bacterium]
MKKIALTLSMVALMAASSTSLFASESSKDKCTCTEKCCDQEKEACKKDGKKACCQKEGDEKKCDTKKECKKGKKKACCAKEEKK